VYAAQFVVCAARPHPGARPPGTRRSVWRALYVGCAGVNTHASEFRSYVRRLVLPWPALTPLVNGALMPMGPARYWCDRYCCAVAGGPTAAAVYLYAAAGAEGVPGELLTCGEPLDLLLLDGATLPPDQHAVLVAPHTLLRTTRLLVE
jgi:hypothetical protein